MIGGADYHVYPSHPFSNARISYCIISYPINGNRRMKMNKMTAILTAMIMLSVGCADNTVTVPKDSESANPTDPTPIPDTPKTIDHKIQLVVQGSVTSATIKATSEKEGTQVLTAQLPWTASFHVNKDTTFLSISATTFEAGYVSVQIWVDNKLFRETVVSSTFPDPILGVSAVISGNFDISETALSLLPISSQAPPD